VVNSTTVRNVCNKNFRPPQYVTVRTVPVSVQVILQKETANTQRQNHIRTINFSLDLLYVVMFQQNPPRVTQHETIGST